MMALVCHFEIYPELLRVVYVHLFACSVVPVTYKKCFKVYIQARPYVFFALKQQLQRYMTPIPKRITNQKHFAIVKTIHCYLVIVEMTVIAMVIQLYHCLLTLMTLRVVGMLTLSCWTVVRMIPLVYVDQGLC